MNRREFLSMGVAAAAASLLPAADLFAGSNTPTLKPALPDVFAIVGPSKSGKSLLAAELAVARAGFSSTFLGRFSVTHGSTLLLDNQHTRSVLLKRIVKIAEGFDLSKLDLSVLVHCAVDFLDLRGWADCVAYGGFKHVIIDSHSIFDRCTYDYRDEAGVSFTKPFRFDREFRRHVGEEILTDLLRERGITCAFTCSQNTEPVSDDPADCVSRDNDEVHATRDAIVIRYSRFVDHLGVTHSSKIRTFSGRGALVKSFAPGEQHVINPATLRFERIS